MMQDFNDKASDKQTSSAKTKKIAVSIILAVLILGISFHFYKKYSLQSLLRALVLKDNILIEEILTIDKNSPNITYGEYFKKAQKNIESRDDIIYNLKILSPYLYKKELDMYLELLNLENECVRSEVSLSHARLEVNSKWEWSQKERYEYLTSNYYSSEMYRRSYRKSLEEAKKAFEDLDKKRNDYHEVIKKFLTKEKDYWKYLTPLMPNRNIVNILEEKIKNLTPSDSKDDKTKS